MAHKQSRYTIEAEQLVEELWDKHDDLDTVWAVLNDAIENFEAIAEALK